MATPDCTVVLPVPAAPRPKRSVNIAADHEDGETEDRLHKLALYSNFLSDVALIDRKAGSGLQNEIHEALSQYTSQTADSVKMNFVADGPKLRKARKIVMEDFSSSQRKRTRNLETQSSRQRCTATLAKYHNELDKLVGGRNVWLPEGTDVNTITYENILNIRKIVNFTIAQAPDCNPSSLWSANDGALFGIKYTGKALSKLWASMSQGQRSQSQPPPSAAGAEDEAVNLPPSSPNAGVFDDLDDADQPNDFPFFPIDAGDESELDAGDEDGDANLQDVPLQEDAEGSPSSHSSPETGRRARQPAVDIGDKPDTTNSESAATPSSLFNRINLPNTPKPPGVATPSPPLLILPSSQLRGSSPPLPPSSLGLKRSRSSQSLGPAKKKRSTAEAQDETDSPITPKAEFSVDSIAPGRYLSDAFMLHVLDMVVSLCPLSVQLVDPLLSKPDRPKLPPKLRDELISRRNSVILCPVNLTQVSKHWVLAVASGNTVTIYDSLPGATDKAELKARLQGVVECLQARQPASASDNDEVPDITYSHEACAVQDDGVNCGVAVMVNALYVVAGVEVPVDLPDYAVWRRILAAFATGDGIMAKGFGPSTTGTGGHVLPASSLSVPPAPPVGDLTQAQFSAWRRRTAAYQASVKKALQEAKAKHTRAISTLSTAAALWADVTKVGTGLWSPRLQMRASTDFLDELQAEYSRYLSAANSIRSCVDADSELIDKIEKKMNDLKRLQGRRTAVVSRVAALSHALHEEQLANGRQAQDQGWDWEDGDAEQS